jgi:hypothetical protein
MKKLSLFLALLLVTISIFSAIIYVNSGSTSVFYKDGGKYQEGIVLAPGDKISVNEFIYVSGLTVYPTGTTYLNPVIAAVKTEVATPTFITVNMTELTDVEIKVKVATSTWYMYFNDVTLPPVILYPDVEFKEVFNTSMFNKVIFMTTASASTTIQYQLLKK